MRHKAKGSNPDVAVDDLFFRKTAHSDRLLARLCGLEGFSGLRSLSINELAEKVFTTEAAWTSR
jgi:hypothetical protein